MSEHFECDESVSRGWFASWSQKTVDIARVLAVGSSSFEESAADEDGSLLQGRLSGGIESQRETQTAAFTKPEKHWAPGPRGAAYA